MPDSKIFQTLFDDHMVRLWSLALRLCGSREDAEDVLQEAAITGFRAFDRFEPNTHFGAWMSAILVNVHRNRLRAQSRRVTTVSLDDLSSESEGGENVLYGRLKSPGREERRDDPARRFLETLDAAVITEAFARLPFEFRECCALFWVGELSYEDIARALNVPIGTVRSRLHRGRKLLQSALWELAVERGLVRDDDEPHKRRGTKAENANISPWMSWLGSALTSWKVGEIQ